MNNTIVLFPGGFKPLTGAHIALAQRYADLSNVERVILLIGPKERDGITREKSMEMFALLNSNPKIIMQPTEFNSPVLSAYEYLFALPEDAQGEYAMAASTKGDDYVRAKDFVPNVDKYREVGDKKEQKIPAGVTATELNVAIDPLTTEDGQPISATAVRQALHDANYDEFSKAYPNQSTEEIRNAWQILTGLSESKYTKDWWLAQLQEDVEDMFEGYMDPKTTELHQKKINKLKKFLDSNFGKPFVYDFDNFDKTVFGVHLQEGVISENYITREELRQIEPTIDRFFKRFGIDVDFQGKFTHFIERLNDPRNEGTIRLEDLENLFRDLSDEFGAQIVQQFQSGNPSAVESDYQFDVPIHMPFQLEFDRQLGQIKLIPRTIKAQRRAWQSNNPRDVIYKIESSETGDDILTEGGAAGHLAHVYEDYSLTFGDMKEIVARALEGRLDIEEAVTEKTDGQNIQVTWRNGEVGFARNKSTIINPMSVAEIQSKFEGRGTIAEAFGEAAEDLSAAFQKIPEGKLEAIFKNGRVFANLEIIYPANKNVIAYEKAVLQFHNLVEYNESGQVVETDLAGGGTLQRIIQDANAHLQKTFSFIPPQRIKLGRLTDFEDQQAAFFNEIDQLKTRYALKDTDPITEYHRAWWSDVIKTQAEKSGYDIPEDILNVLVNRWSFSNKEMNIANIKKSITNTQFAEWVTAFDKKDFKEYRKQNMEPFESIFLRLGATVLKNAQNFLAANPSKAVQSIKQELAELIKDLQTTGDVETIKKLEHELRRIQRLGGFEAIVPSEGIVFVYGGHTYKLVGAFAPVNQLLGTLKYIR